MFNGRAVSGIQISKLPMAHQPIRCSGSDGIGFAARHPCLLQWREMLRFEKVYLRQLG